MIEKRDEILTGAVDDFDTSEPNVYLECSAEVITLEFSRTRTATDSWNLFALHLLQVHANLATAKVYCGGDLRRFVSYDDFVNVRSPHDGSGLVRGAVVQGALVDEFNHLRFLGDVLSDLGAAGPVADGRRHHQQDEWRE